MLSLKLRLANREAIIQGIARRQAAASTPTYAEILATKTAQQISNLLQTEPGQPSNPAPEPIHTHLHLANHHDRPLIPTTNQTEAAFIDGGWTTVTRKKKTRLSKQESKPAPTFNKHTAVLKAQGRCFHCLDRGHTQFQCRNGVRCHKCQGIGHISKICTSGIKRDISTPLAPTKHIITEHKEITVLEQTKNLEMDFENWETAPMLSPDLVQGRAPELCIFFPPNDNLRPSNALLNRAAIILLGPRAATVSQLHTRIAEAIANTFGGHSEEFKVDTLHPAVGDLIVEFPSNTLRNLAVHVGVFTIARGVQVQLRAWTPNLNMIRDPTTHKARITLHGVPMQYWNFPNINQLISGFGYVECMMPVVSNGNFETLRVLISCYDPSSIPPSVSLHKNPSSTVVYIHLEGWLHNQLPPPPPSHHPSDDEDGQGSSNFGPQRGAHRHRAPLVPPAGGYARRPARQGQERGPNRGSSREYGTRTGDNSQKFQKNELDGAVAKGTCQLLPRGEKVIFFQQEKDKAPAFSFTLQHASALVNTHATTDNKTVTTNLGMVNFGNPPREWSNKAFSPFWNMPPDSQQKGGVSILVESTQDKLKGTCLLSDVENSDVGLVGGLGDKNQTKPGLEDVIILEQGQEAQHESRSKDSATDQLLGPASLAGLVEIEEDIEGFDFSVQNGPHGATGAENGLENTTITNEMQALTISPEKGESEYCENSAMDDAPPGFEGPPRFKKKFSRRSPRLQIKNLGRYISAIDQARATQGFITVANLMQKSKTKARPTTKPSLEYLKTYNPLTQGHAEAVVAAAGADLDDELKRKIEEATAGMDQSGHAVGAN